MDRSVKRFKSRRSSSRSKNVMVKTGVFLLIAYLLFDINDHDIIMNDHHQYFRISDVFANQYPTAHSFHSF